MRKILKAELKVLGFKPAKGGRMAKDYGKIVGWVYLYRSRFSNSYMLEAGVTHKEAPTDITSDHFSLRIENVMPSGGDLKMALNIENDCTDEYRARELRRAVQFIEDIMCREWANEEWLFNKALSDYDPKIPIVLPLRHFVEKLQRKGDTIKE